jgi:acyl carrier protein
MKVTVDELKKCFAPAIPADVLAKLDPALPLATQGVDSLSLTTMAVALQNTYKVKLTVEDGLKLKTLNDVITFLNKA